MPNFLPFRETGFVYVDGMKFVGKKKIRFYKNKGIRAIRVSKRIRGIQRRKKSFLLGKKVVFCWGLQSRKPKNDFRKVEVGEKRQG